MGVWVPVVVGVTDEVAVPVPLCEAVADEVAVCDGDFDGVIAVHAAAPVDDVEPAAQARQAARPVVGAYVFTAQGKHADEPVDAANVPGLHAEHVPDSEEYPI